MQTKQHPQPVANKSNSPLTEIAVFSENKMRITTFTTNDGELWWKLQDVCAAINYSDPRNAHRWLDEDEKKLLKITDLKNINIKVAPRGAWFINESGLYHVLFKANVPGANKFRRWVTQTVLPSIRRRGVYSAVPFDVSIKKVKSHSINGRKMFLYIEALRAIGASTRSSSSKRRQHYWMHFVEWNNRLYITEEYALQLALNHRVRTNRTVLKAMQPVIPLDFGTQPLPQLVH